MDQNPLKRLFVAPSGPGSDPAPWSVHAFNALLVFLGVTALFVFAFSRSIYGWDWGSIASYWPLLVRGWIVTLAISVVALLLSVALGSATALARRSRILPLRHLAGLYVELVRGTPLLIQILVLYYVVAHAFGVDQRYAMGTLALALFTGAYIGEVIRAGIDGVGASQIESARAVGFTPLQIYRHIVLPQATRQILPALAGQFVSLVKDSSLLQIIAITELTFSAQQVAANTFSKLEAYLLLVPGYLILTLPISLWSRRLERRLHYET